MQRYRPSARPRTSRPGRGLGCASVVPVADGVEEGGDAGGIGHTLMHSTVNVPEVES